MKKKKKKEKGFSMIELIITIGIIGTVLGIAGILFTNIINNSTTTTKDLTKNNVLKAGKIYVEEYPEEISWRQDNTKKYTCITINELVNKNLLKKEILSKELPSNNIVVTKNENKTTTGNFDESNTKCDGNFVPIPTKDFCTNPTYNGQEQVITITDNEKINFSNNKKTNAGTYQITTTLKSPDYTWKDGTKTEKYINCSIKKATPILTLASNGSEGKVGKTITTKITTNVKGTLTVKSSNPEYFKTTIDNNIITNPQTDMPNLAIEFLSTKENKGYITVTLTPTDSNNYYSTSTTFTIGEINRIEVEKPKCKNNNLIYNNTEQELVTPTNGTTFYNYKATEIGNHEVIAKLKYGYIWKETKGTEDITLICPIKAKITYNKNGGSGTNYSETVQYESNYITKNNSFTKAYYTFKGWNESPNGTGSDWTNKIGKNWQWTYKKNVTLYAQWEANKYAITLDKKGGTDGTNGPIYQKYETGWYLDSNVTNQITKINIPQKTGYTFEGYYYTNTKNEEIKIIDSSGNIIVSNKEFTTNHTLYAKWSIKTYNVNYNYNLSQSFTNTQYIDTGYKTNWDKDFTISSTFKISSGNKRHLIIGNYNGSDAKALSIEVNANNALRVYMGTGQVDKTSGTVAINQNITVVFTWTASSNKYTITATGTNTNISFNGTYDIGGTSANALRIGTVDCRGSSSTFNPITITTLTFSNYYNHNEQATLPSAVREGYTFNGWYTTSSSGTKISNLKVTKNQTIYAQWNAKTYTVTLNNQSATTAGTTSIYGTYNTGVYLNSTKTKLMSTSANPITKPTKNGYTFGGYYTSTNGGGTQMINASGYITSNFTKTKYSANVTLYAKWTEHTLTVKYYSNFANSSFNGELNANNQVLVRTTTHYYSEDNSDGLWNYSKPGSSTYLGRNGYTATGNWGTSPTGGKIVGENTGFATGQAMAKALGQDLTNGNASVNVYPQWTANKLTINYWSNFATSAFPNARNPVGANNNVIVRVWETDYTYQTTDNLHNYANSGDGTYLARSGYTATGYWGTTTSGGTTLHQDTNFKSAAELASKFGQNLATGNVVLNLYAQWTANKLTINYWSNFATSAFPNAKNPVGANNNVIVRVWEINYTYQTTDNLHNYANPGDGTYLARSGYAATGYWGTTTSGGTTLHQDTNFKSAAELASKFGQNLATGNVVLNLYAQWKRSLMYPCRSTDPDTFIAGQTGLLNKPHNDDGTSSFQAIYIKSATPVRILGETGNYYIVETTDDTVIASGNKWYDGIDTNGDGIKEGAWGDTYKRGYMLKACLWSTPPSNSYGWCSPSNCQDTYLK